MIDKSRKISELWWNGKYGDLTIKPKDGQRIEVVNEFHGAYDLDWAIVYEGDKEVARHNIMYVSSIVWEY